MEDHPQLEWPPRTSHDTVTAALGVTTPPLTPAHHPEGDEGLWSSWTAIAKQQEETRSKTSCLFFVFVHVPLGLLMVAWAV